MVELVNGLRRDINILSLQGFRISGVGLNESDFRKLMEFYKIDSKDVPKEGKIMMMGYFIELNNRFRNPTILLSI